MISIIIAVIVIAGSPAGRIDREARVEVPSNTDAQDLGFRVYAQHRR